MRHTCCTSLSYSHTSLVVNSRSLRNVSVEWWNLTRCYIVDTFVGNGHTLGQFIVRDISRGNNTDVIVLSIESSIIWLVYPLEIVHAHQFRTSKSLFKVLAESSCPFFQQYPLLEGHGRQLHDGTHRSLPVYHSSLQSRPSEEE